VPTNFFAAYQGCNDRDLHANLGRIYSGPNVAQNPSSRERPRIGIVSALLRDHTIGRLNLGRIERLDRERFEVVVCAAGQIRDPLAQAFQRTADRFVPLPRDVAAARRLIAEQELDLLLFTDVGMDALTYTLAFSRMAPVQCATWGHPVTTGSPAIDHFISSRLLELPEADDHYTERLARLPSLGTWYPRPAPPRGDERAALDLARELNVYACPQTLFKLHPEFDGYLADILRRDPRGVVVLIEGRVPMWTELLKARFDREMPDVLERICWAPALPRERFLGLLAAADVVLDPIHFGGGNSSYESLAMGTPLVTQPGRLLRSRITQALYAKCGIDELVAGSREEYVELAVGLAGDRERAHHHRQQIGERAPSLFEDEDEVRDLEEFLAAALAR
jgi:protein O-GlcNAc transferase